jgi:regulator of RNase E activity RraA
MITPDVLATLRRFDTPTICNVIELFEVRPRTAGYMDDRIRACYPHLPPMVGFASTATFRADAPPPGGSEYGGMDDQIEHFAELDGPPVVVFQDLDDPSVAATFGEVMCTTYQAFGATGLITSGTGRDLEQVGELDFPVFTNGAICSHGYVHFPQLQVPVRIGGITVQPNDLLHGDANGVTTIPKEIAAEVADICDEFVAAEMIVIEAMRSGAPTLKAFNEARAESHQKMAELAKRIRK